MTQDLIRIRAWARDNNIPVGSRGRLPRDVLDAYLKATSRAAQESSPSGQDPQPAPVINTYEPLIDYLEPRFGNIYDMDNAIVPWVDEDGFDVQPWTEELKEAVTDYLLHEVSDADYATFLDTYASGSGPPDRQTEQMAWIMDYNQPWEVADAFHRIAIKKAPTLDAVLKQRPPDLGIEDLKWDAMRWLQAHATYEQIVEAARHRHLGSKLPTHEAASLLPGSDYEFFARGDVIAVLTEELSPDELLEAWDYVADSSPSDLAEEEWTQLEPLLPRDNGNPRATRLRQAINGMLYQHAHRGARSPLPLRYGRSRTLYARKRLYRKSGVFTEVLAALEGNPEAARITAWLWSELGQS